MAVVEMCWRCPTPMTWAHGSWQCSKCRFKLGCCEGEPQTCSDAGAAAQPTRAEPARR